MEQSKVILGNFYYPAQVVGISKDKGKQVSTKLIMGFENNSNAPLIYSKLYSDIFYLLLLYDVLVIDLLSIPYFINFFGFKDFIFLLNNDCIKIIFDSGYSSALTPNGNIYEAIFFYRVNEDKTLDNIGVIEDKLKNIHNHKSYSSNVLYLIEKNSIIFNNEDISSTIHKELDYDLLNQNVTNYFNIISKDRNNIRTPDVYKILRLLHLNKFLVYSKKFECDNVIVDGLAHEYLNQKVSPILKS